MRVSSTASHSYDSDGPYEVTVTLIEGNSSITGACEPGSVSWIVQIDSSGVSEVAVATVVGSGAPVDVARFEGRYSLSAVISGVQYPESVYPPGYGVEAIGESYFVQSSTAAPQCDSGPCDTTWDIFSSANPHLYSFNGTTYRKVLMWGEIPGGSDSCPDDIASITEVQVVSAIVVGDRTIAAELSGVQQGYSRSTADCIRFTTRSEAWSIRLTADSLASFAAEQATIDEAGQAAAEPEATADPAPENDAAAAEGVDGDEAAVSAEGDTRIATNTLFEAGRSNFVASVPTPSETPTAAADLASSALIALAMVVLIVFPAQLFNSTFSSHYDDIAGGTRRRFPWIFTLFPVEGETAASDAGPFERVVMAKFLGLIAAAAVLKAFLDPQVGANKATLLTALGFLTGLALYLGIATSIGLRLGRTLGRTDAYFKLLPGSLLVGLVCVIISRVVGFLPGYLYVFVGSLAFRGSLDDDGNARNAATTAITLLIIGVVGWVALGPVSANVDSTSDPGVPILWLESTLAATFAIGIHSALFRMMPITFMAGHKIWTVSRRRWAAIYVPVVFLFVHLGGQRSGDSSTVDWATTLSLFALFGLASVLFWAYWRNRDRQLEQPEMAHA